VNYSYACHHIHPLGAGGGNGVLLSPGDHGKFTAWCTKTTYMALNSPAAADPDCP
jgi:hypothetical protein